MPLLALEELDVNAWGTPWIPVLAAFGVPEGAASEVTVRAISGRHRDAKGLSLPGKFPPLAEAVATAEVSSAEASVGTVDRRPMRAGSCEGYVKLP